MAEDKDINFFDSPEHQRAAERFLEVGPLGLNAQDQQNLGNVPSEEQSKNPDKTLGELMPQEKIGEFVDGMYADFQALSDIQRENPDRGAEVLKQGRLIQATLRYLDQIGKLPEEYRDMLE